MKYEKIAWVSLAFVWATAPAVSAAIPTDELLRASGIQGGIVVHLGCGDGVATSALKTSDRFLVHGLDTDPAKVEAAKTHIDALGLYGGVSAQTYDGRTLPYGDNMVNLIVVDEAPDLDSSEIERVLVPNGAVWFRSGSTLQVPSHLEAAGSIQGWEKYLKPWPAAIDQWTHYLYDATGNAVSKDKKVRRPRHVQWYAGPKRSRHHDALASLSAMTSSNGRLFYIYDEGSTSIVHRPPHWKLIARDAFNGKVLWKRDIPTWMTHLYNFRAGPKQLPRRLVSVGDSVYVTLGLSAAVVRLDGATGKTLATYVNSEKTEELVCHDGILLAVIGDPELLMEKADGCFGYWELAEYEDPTVDKSIVAYDAETGKKLWAVTGDPLRHTVPLSLCALGRNVFYLDNKELHCVDVQTGRQRWASPFETKGLFIRSYAPTVVVHDDVIMCLTWNRLRAYAVTTGKTLWENKGAIGFGSPGDLFAIDGKAWAVPMTKAIAMDSKRNRDGIVTTGIGIPKTNFLNEAKTAVGIDIHTGQITDELPFAHTQHHHRCYRNKATERYLLIGHSGIQVVDLKTQVNETHRWVRGLCQYGIMPANGYVYVPPDTCQCYSSGKINGLFALSESNSWETIEIVPVLEKGPVFTLVQAKRDLAPLSEGSWPTYRGNNARSGSTIGPVPAAPGLTWRAHIGGGTLTAPVVAGDRVFVAERDAYAVHCLDTQDGKALWKYLADGPIDSPPTIYKGLCIFGCGDGSVTCLDAATGKQAWRFKTSQIERRIGHEDRLESPLRIHGSVLVQQGTVYFAGGYSSNLDGGIRLYGLDAWTGEQHHTGKVASGHWGDDGQWGFLADILVSDGKTIGMRNVGFDGTLAEVKGRAAIVAATGFLDDSWFHRQGWSSPMGGKGQLLVFDEDRSASIASPYTGLKQRRKAQYEAFNQVGHFHQKFTRYKEEFFPVGTTITFKAGRKGGDGWSQDVDLQPRAMVLAGDKLCVAGWLDAVVIETKTGRAKSQTNPDPHDSILRIYSADTGESLSESVIEAEPVFDGMAVADGKLFLALKNGSLLCLGR